MTDSSSELPAEAPAEAPVSDVKPTDPSPVENQGVEANPLLDAVTAALEPRVVESPATRDGKDQAPPETAQDGKTAETDPLSDTGKYPKTAEGRIRHLNDQKKGLETEVEVLRGEAALSQKITGYLESNGIEPEELDNTLAITAAIKRGRFGEALKLMTPVYQELQKRAGEVLPAELQQAVRDGKISQAHARELHKSRTELSNSKAQDQETQQRKAAEKRQADHQTTVTSSAQAVTEWERGKAAADPDWQLKQGFLATALKAETLEFARTNQRFPTAKEAVTLADAALKNIETQMKAISPKSPAKTTVTGHSASPRSRAAPKNLMDAVDIALAA